MFDFEIVTKTRFSRRVFLTKALSEKEALTNLISNSSDFNQIKAGNITIGIKRLKKKKEASSNNLQKVTLYCARCQKNTSQTQFVSTAGFIHTCSVCGYKYSVD